MKRRNRALSILKDQSGTSFVFVLGVMLLLMAIAVSTLVSASANAGYTASQQEHNRMTLLADSIQNNLLYSLRQEGESSLSEQLVYAIYEANDSDLSAVNANGLGSMDINIDVDGLDLSDSGVKLEYFTLSFPEQYVIITPEVPKIPETPQEDDGAGNVLVEADPGAPGEPKTATVDAMMTATVAVSVNEKTFTSRAVYMYTGGVLCGVGDDGEMSVTDPGEWRLIKHERVD